MVISETLFSHGINIKQGSSVFKTSFLTNSYIFLSYLSFQNSHNTLLLPNIHFIFCSNIHLLYKLTNCMSLQLFHPHIRRLMVDGMLNVWFNQIGSNNYYCRNWPRCEIWNTSSNSCLPVLNKKPSTLVSAHHHLILASRDSVAQLI